VYNTSKIIDLFSRAKMKISFVDIRMGTAKAYMYSWYYFII